MPGVETLFPPEVALVVWTGPAGEEVLVGPEAEAASTMAPARRRQFAAGRAAAREALARLGGPRAGLPRDGRGVVAWPAGFIGSITHCDGLVAAAAARTPQLAGLGLDAEPRRPLPPEVVEMVTGPEEREWYQPAGRWSPGLGDLVAFALKEAAFKCWFPAIRLELEFRDLIVLADPASGQAPLRLPAVLRERLPPGSRLEARWALTDSHVMAGAVLYPAGQAAAGFSAAGEGRSGPK